MDELEELLNQTIEKFRTKVAEDEAIRKELEGTKRLIFIDVIGKEGYSFLLDGPEIKDFGKGNVDEPDIRVTATEEDLILLFKGELKPMKAWATKRLKVKASLEDLLRVKRFLG
jgi:putative sterol carrier protein